MSSPMYYAELPAAPRLGTHVLTHWCVEAALRPGETLEHHLWPDGCVAVAVVVIPGAPARASVVGPTVSAHRVTLVAGARYAGSRMWPDAGGLLLGVAPSELRDRIVPAHELLGSGARTLVDAVAPALTAADLRAPDGAGLAAALDAWLAPLVEAAPAPDPRVRAAVREIVAAPDAPMTEVARAAGLGLRQLERHFARAVGLTPKEYARLRRVRTGMAAAMAGDAAWSELAAELAYADQAHLIREFVAITGFRPGELRRRLRDIDHGPVDP
jgi:AraC-like DNA-binding protein